jgi:hypothetical protein
MCVCTCQTSANTEPHQFYLGVGAINLFGDICILAVPVANVLKLQMRTPQKIAICFMFLLGSLYVPSSSFPLFAYLPPLTHSLTPLPASASPPCTA